MSGAHSQCSDRPIRSREGGGVCFWTPVATVIIRWRVSFRQCLSLFVKLRWKKITEQWKAISFIWSFNNGTASKTTIRAKINTNVWAKFIPVMQMWLIMKQEKWYYINVCVCLCVCLIAKQLVAYSSQVSAVKLKSQFLRFTYTSTDGDPLLDSLLLFPSMYKVSAVSTDFIIYTFFCKRRGQHFIKSKHVKFLKYSQQQRTLATSLPSVKKVTRLP